MKYIHFRENKMANEGKFVEGLAKTFALIGGAYIFVELLKLVSKKEIYYCCPQCNEGVKYGMKNCPHCQVDLTWTFKNPQK